jgi:hypothetical protein
MWLIAKRRKKMVKPILTDRNVIAVANDDGSLTPVEGNADGAIKVVVQESVEIDADDLIIIDRTFVKNADIGANYASGSQGQVKTAKTYKANASGGDPATLVTYLYADTDFPEQWSKYTESSTTV